MATKTVALNDALTDMGTIVTQVIDTIKHESEQMRHHHNASNGAGVDAAVRRIAEMADHLKGGMATLAAASQAQQDAAGSSASTDALGDENGTINNAAPAASSATAFGTKSQTGSQDTPGPGAADATGEVKHDHHKDGKKADKADKPAPAKASAGTPNGKSEVSTANG